MMSEERMTPVELHRIRRFPFIRALLGLIVFLLATFFFWRFLVEAPVDYTDITEHFKYGSIGSDSEGGIPYWIWQVLPEMFPQYLPDPQAFRALPPEQRTGLNGYAQLGFIVEEGKDLPIGFSKRRVAMDRVGLNCAVCHVGTVRVTEGMNPQKVYPDREPYYVTSQKERLIVLGMPAHTVDLQSYFEFLFKAAADGRFTVANVMSHIAARTDLGMLERFFYRRAIPVLRETLLMRRRQLAFLSKVPRFGPGRVDTFNPYKAIQFSFPYDGTIGTADFPSLWNQRPREGMHLHWDGNNQSVFERNISASLGAGATPVSLDMPRMLRVAAWCGSPDPTEKVSERIRLQREQEARAHPFPRKGELPIPQYPFDIDEQAAAQGKALYAEHCASCHDWQGNEIGQVTHIVYVGTDPKRLESFTEDLVANQNTLGAGQWWRFRHFRKTHGYANMPLDGIWARAPYLHNGSVPTLRDLLNNPADRPQEFYRGDDEYDPHNVGFRSDRAVAADGRKLFKFNTRLPGNHNGGHQYGTELSPQEKNDLLEYLKTIGRKENST